MTSSWPLATHHRSFIVTLPLRLKSPANRLFIQQLLFYGNYKGIPLTKGKWCLNVVTPSRSLAVCYFSPNAVFGVQSRRFAYVKGLRWVQLEIKPLDEFCEDYFHFNLKDTTIYVIFFHLSIHLFLWGGVGWKLHISMDMDDNNEFHYTPFKLLGPLLLTWNSFNRSMYD